MRYHLGAGMAKRHCCLPPGALDELITRIEELEKQVEALTGAARAFAVVFEVPRIPGTNDGGAPDPTH